MSFSMCLTSASTVWPDVTFMLLPSKPGAEYMSYKPFQNTHTIVLFFILQNAQQNKLCHRRDELCLDASLCTYSLAHTSIYQQSKCSTEKRCIRHCSFGKRGSAVKGTASSSNVTIRNIRLLTVTGSPLKKIKKKKRCRSKVNPRCSSFTRSLLLMLSFTKYWLFYYRLKPSWQHLLLTKARKKQKSEESVSWNHWWWLRQLVNSATSLSAQLKCRCLFPFEVC